MDSANKTVLFSMFLLSFPSPLPTTLSHTLSETLFWPQILILLKHSKTSILWYYLRDRTPQKSNNFSISNYQEATDQGYFQWYILLVTENLGIVCPKLQHCWKFLLHNADIQSHYETTSFILLCRLRDKIFTCSTTSFLITCSHITKVQTTIISMKNNIYLLLPQRKLYSCTLWNIQIFCNCMQILYNIKTKKYINFRTYTLLHALDWLHVYA